MKTLVALFLVALLSTAPFTLAQETSNPAAGPNSAPNSAPVPPPSLSGTGTPNHITKWLTTTSIENSGIFENSAGNVGIGTTTPAGKLDVKGTGDFRDTLTLFPNGTHPTLSISGTAFQINNIGRVTFVAGQNFPGTGTVTTVNSGAGLTGGPIHGIGTLSINSSVIPFLAKANVFTASQTIKAFLLADDVFLNGSAAGLVGEGGNPTLGQPGNSLTVFGGSPSSPATDVAGGDLILAGGTGFGAGGGGAVRIQTAPAGPSGSNADNLVDRQIFAPKAVSMGGQNGAATMFFVTVANGDAATTTVHFTINANDGGSNFVMETGSCTGMLVMSPDGSSNVATFFLADNTSLGSVNAFCFQLSSNFNQLGVGVGDNLAFVPTTHEIYLEIDNISGSPLSNPALTTPVHPNRMPRADALHRQVTIHRGR